MKTPPATAPDLNDLLRRVDRTPAGMVGRAKIDHETLAASLPGVDDDPAMVAATADLESARREAAASTKALEDAERKAAKASTVLAKAIAAGRDLAALRKVKADGRDDHEDVDLLRQAATLARRKVLEAERRWQAVAADAGDRVALELDRKYRRPLEAALAQAQRRVVLLTVVSEAVRSRISSAARHRVVRVTVSKPGVEYRRRDGQPIDIIAAAADVEPVAVRTLHRVPLDQAEAMVARGEAEWVETWRGELGGGDA